MTTKNFNADLFSHLSHNKRTFSFSEMLGEFGLEGSLIDRTTKRASKLRKKYFNQVHDDKK